ncbi:VIT family protein [Parabacteroides sp. 52]|uniref:VIT1/CCC1 transporter family protein n=1 Tax=unclassified Parabacteroides TaxID=2649774 RepID=UPI0013D4FB3B|nr:MULTISPECIES: VIT family protein [unclassified Parabacteroides]MDH6535728.1 VIT1/CCC1 family predicted Fe2+/Mn2+ transporter [Parabacteroides sp. PM5-20]NDV56325.1 VIT family protein [Parabacteroides sp. 52]
MHREKHFTNRTNWLRAAVLGANDGILSTTSIVIGVAAADTSRNSIVLAALAGLVAGACSMAAGEYVSVSSQTDVETADLNREKSELTTMPEQEVEELAGIYEGRGLDKELAHSVAIQLMKHNALEAHARDELGINDLTKPNPLQAAMASAASFISGGILPFLVSVLAPIKGMVFCQYGFAILFLAVSGAVAAKMGGSNIYKSIARICFWGTVAMFISALVGYIFGVQTS